MIGELRDAEALGVVLALNTGVPEGVMNPVEACGVRRHGTKRTRDTPKIPLHRKRDVDAGTEWLPCGWVYECSNLAA